MHARENALAGKFCKELGMRACLDQLDQALPADAVLLEQRACDEAEQSCKAPVPDLKRRDLLGEAIEQPGVIDERERDDGRETVGRGKRRRSAARLRSRSRTSPSTSIPISDVSANIRFLMSRR